MSDTTLSLQEAFTAAAPSFFRGTPAVAVAGALVETGNPERLDFHTASNIAELQRYASLSVKVTPLSV